MLLTKRENAQELVKWGEVKSTFPLHTVRCKTPVRHPEEMSSSCLDIQV